MMRMIYAKSYSNIFYYSIFTMYFTLDQSLEFQPFQATFTNLGTNGRNGPTSLGTHYVGQEHEYMVTVSNGIQYWTVPYSGTYQITAVGAAGGYDKNGPGPRGIFTFFH
jgi:hypothetical protein